MFEVGVAGVVGEEGMDWSARVSQRQRVEQGHDTRQQGRSGSGGVVCQNFVAVLVGPEAQGERTTRRRAVVAEIYRGGLIALNNNDLGRIRRMEPVGVIGVCFAHDILAWSQSAKRNTAPGSSALRHGRKTRVGYRGDAERPAAQRLLRRAY